MPQYSIDFIFFIQPIFTHIAKAQASQYTFEPFAKFMRDVSNQSHQLGFDQLNCIINQKTDFQMMNCCSKRGKEDQPRELQSQLSKAMYIEKYIFQNCKEEEDKPISVQNGPVKMIGEQRLTKQDWLRLIHIKKVKDVSNKLILYNLQKGIPKDLRPAIWIWMSGAENIRTKHGNDLYNKLKSSPSIYDSVIFREVQRSKSKNSDELFDALRAYSNYDNELKINQDMVLLMQYLFDTLNHQNYADPNFSFARTTYEIQQTDIMAFWMFLYITHELKMRESLSCKLSKRQLYILNNSAPNLLSHLAKYGIQLKQVALHTPLIHMMKQASKEKFNIIFDTFLFQGEETIIELYTQIISISEDVILSLSRQEDILIYLNESMISYGLANLAIQKQTN